MQLENCKGNLYTFALKVTALTFYFSGKWYFYSTAQSAKEIPLEKWFERKMFLIHHSNPFYSRGKRENAMNDFLSNMMDKSCCCNALLLQTKQTCGYI